MTHPVKWERNMISVIDYGVCNLGSILNMLRKVGAEAQRVSTPDELQKAEKIILPGVGAFDNGMAALHKYGLVKPLRSKALEEKIPLLGVCLGMQMLGRRSEEGDMDGLGLISAEARKFSFTQGSALKVPHMGWGLLSPRRDSVLLKELDLRSRFYFCHSYRLVCDDSADILADANHGSEFAAMVQHNNIFGVQFHPEKSHRFGMTLLRNFAEMRCHTHA
jgi:glutamine amidotransferase